MRINENAKTRIGMLETWLPMLQDQVDSLERRVKELERNKKADKSCDSDKLKK